MFDKIFAVLRQLAAPPKTSEESDRSFVEPNEPTQHATEQEQEGTQPLTERQQRAVESIQEDETLTSDFTDEQARPLIDWASQQAYLVAGDTTLSDEEVDHAVVAIRRALLRVATIAADEYNPERLLAIVQAEFEKGH